MNPKIVPKIVIDYKEVLTKDISLLENCVRPPFNELIIQDGQHYKFLAYLSGKFENSTLIDIGTHVGCSSLSLATNPTNKIISYDVAKFPTALKYNGTDNILSIPNNNITYKIGNALTEPELLKSPLIFLDTRHTGKFELEVYQYLHKNNYKGLLVLDDIHYCPQMKKFWDLITHYPKYDITEIGHYIPLVGTGIVNFSDNPLEFIKCDLKCIPTLPTLPTFPDNMETYIYDKNYVKGQWL